LNPVDGRCTIHTPHKANNNNNSKTTCHMQDLLLTIISTAVVTGSGVGLPLFFLERNNPRAEQQQQQCSLMRAIAAVAIAIATTAITFIVATAAAMDCRLCRHSNNKCSNDGGSNAKGKMAECRLTAMSAALVLMTMMTNDVPGPFAQLFSRVDLPCSLFGEEEHRQGQQQPQQQRQQHSLMRATATPAAAATTAGTTATAATNNSISTIFHCLIAPSLDFSITICV
jgi:hypothetical protein